MKWFRFQTLFVNQFCARLVRSSSYKQRRCKRLGYKFTGRQEKNCLNYFSNIHIYPVSQRVLVFAEILMNKGLCYRQFT